MKVSHYQIVWDFRCQTQLDRDNDAPCSLDLVQPPSQCTVTELGL